MLMNKFMNNEYKQIKKVNLPSSLSKIINKGFLFDENTYILQYFYQINKKNSKSNYFDSIEFECYFNDIHIDSYVNTDFLSYGIEFVHEVFKKYRSYKREKCLVALISLQNDEFYGVNIKFHTKHDDKYLVNEKDVEAYENEGILILKSN